MVQAGQYLLTAKNTDLAFDFLNATFGADVDLYDDLLVNAGAIASYLPAAQSETYNEGNEFYGGQAVYKDIVEFAGHVPGIDYGAYYSDIRSALTDAITNVVRRTLISIQRSKTLRIP